MQSTHPDKTEAAARIVCELDASSNAQVLLDQAIAHCQRTGAELFVVWILQPQVLHTPYRSSGAIGAWGLPHTLHDAVERARAAGISATSAVRIGARETVLRREKAAAGTVGAYELAA